MNNLANEESNTKSNFAKFYTMNYKCCLIIKDHCGDLEMHILLILSNNNPGRIVLATSGYANLSCKHTLEPHLNANVCIAMATWKENKIEQKENQTK